MIATVAFLLTAGLPLAGAADSGTESAAAKPIRINFQVAGSELVCGYTPDYGRTFRTRNGFAYGWNFDHTDVTRERGVNDDRRLDTLSHFHANGMWEIAVDNGEHRVRVGLGDPSHPSTHTLTVEGTSFVNDKQLAAGQFQTVAKTVTVTDGKLTLDQGAAPDMATRINYIEIDAEGAPSGCDQEDEDVEPSPAPTVSPTEPAQDGPLTPPLRINFQPKGSPEACSYVPDRGRVFKWRNALRYGWNVDHMKSARDRGVRRDQRKDTLIQILSGGRWEMRVPPGEHRVRVGVGDASYASTNTITVEGVNLFDSRPLAASEFATATQVVTVDDGRLTIDAGASADEATRINFVNVNVFEPRGCRDGAISGEATTGDSGTNAPLPARPYGLNELKMVFGEKCNPKANDGRAYWPSAGGRGAHGYVYFHARLADVIGNKILGKINTRGKANDYGVWGYACRFFEQSQSSQESLSTKWSVHSSAAVDTNTLRNASHESVPKLVARAPGSSSGPWRMGPCPRKIWTRFGGSCPVTKAMVWLGPLDD